MVVLQIKMEIQLSINVGSTAILWEKRAAGGRKKRNKQIYVINRRKGPASNIIVADENML